MGNRSTTAKATTRELDLTLQQHETDSPIIPVAQLEQLHRFKPEAVDWVIEQTQIEAEHRRAENRRINTLIFTSQLIGQLCGLLIGLAGVIGGAYVAIAGQPGAGGVIASMAIGSLAVVFVTGRRNADS